ncbi:ATP-dependent RNA helicase Ddx1 [Cimex lectularius]|uniref:ATP-dependent RNA helicase n=1 Tax=Cimex lectularius TaxID=79782 RepID=A0A8I6TCT6_CIMLE|nr:ATP-dependent RNA helicase Ddx1 [Cimex lectularius]
MTAFEEFGVLPEIAKAVDDMEWMLPTDVQSEAIPLILGGGDVLMAAETGSGKTGAFCLPILQIVWETLKEIEAGKSGNVNSTTKPSGTELSKSDRTPAMAISSDGLVCQAREFKEWHGCRGTKGVAGGGKYYYEAKITDEGLCRVGWSTVQAALDLGTDKFGFGYGGTGKKSNNRQFDNYGEPFGKNDIIGCMLDLDAGKISFSKNGEDFGLAFTIPQQLLRSPLYPTVCLKNAEIAFNFGSKPLKHLPKGYKPLTEAEPSHLKDNDHNTSEKVALKKVNNAPQALIIEPSRELAEQTYQQIIKFKKYLDKPNVRELLVIGGVNVKDQTATIEAGVDIVVATPGRLEDFVGMNTLSLAQCRFFVLDEADGLLKQGYKDFIYRMHKQIPKFTGDGKRMQMIVCSATLHDFEVKKMADTLMHFPTWVDLKGEDAVPETVHHVVVKVDPQEDTTWENMSKRVQTDGVHAYDDIKPGRRNAETLSEAVKILKTEYAVRAIKKHNIDRAIIFCRTKIDCDNMEKYLKTMGSGMGKNNPFSCVCLHGDRKPQERKSNYEAFKQGHVKFLICTDVAARGIDIGSLPYVLNITLPDDKSNYVHRIGRVGRADRMGLAISFVSTVPEKVWYHGEWCHSRGRNCYNTNLTDKGGCCIWYNELQYLADIEDHLKITIDQVNPEMEIPKNEFDGKVTYGQKRVNKGSDYKDHVSQMAPSVAELSGLESKAQLIYLKRHFKIAG